MLNLFLFEFLFIFIHFKRVMIKQYSFLPIQIILVHQSDLLLYHRLFLL
jgi:hypothetical protein